MASKKDLTKNLLTTPEVAKRLHCCVETVRRQAKSGTLPAKHVGKRWLIPADKLAEMFESEK